MHCQDYLHPIEWKRTSLCFYRKATAESHTSLNLWKFSTKRFFITTPHRHSLYNLLVPSHPALTGNYNHFLINELRHLFVKDITSKPTRKVFISRLKASRRKILNEDAVVEFLKTQNWEIHYFEDYSFRKQREIMSKTKYLISLHGAGLTNLLFMKEGGKVLELRNKND